MWLSFVWDVRGQCGAAARLRFVRRSRMGLIYRVAIRNRCKRPTWQSAPLCLRRGDGQAGVTVFSADCCSWDCCVVRICPSGRFLPIPLPRTTGKNLWFLSDFCGEGEILLASSHPKNYTASDCPTVPAEKIGTASAIIASRLGFAVIVVAPPIRTPSPR